MEVAYLRSPDHPGTIIELSADAAERSKAKGPFLCISCGQRCVLVKTAEPTVSYPNGRVAHFKHMDKRICDIEECERRVAAHVENRVKQSKLPIYLRKDEDGNYCIVAGLPSLSSEDRLRLRSLGYDMVLLSSGTDSIRRPIEAFSRDGNLEFVKVPTILRLQEKIKLQFTDAEGTKSALASKVLPGWPDEIDTITAYTKYASIFPDGNDKPKIPLGEKIKTDTPYLLVQKMPKPEDIKPDYRDRILESNLVHVENLGEIRLKQSGVALYVIYRVTFPSSTEITGHDYSKLANWVRIRTGVILEDGEAEAVAEGKPIQLNLPGRKYAKGYELPRSAKYKKYK